jgi:hypothetical protein
MDFRYFRRLLDTYLGLAAAMLACLYLVVADVPSAGIFWSFIVVVFLCNGALAFNGFGLDNRAGFRSLRAPAVERQSDPAE